jgi:hypothetical protein
MSIKNKTSPLVIFALLSVLVFNYFSADAILKTEFMSQQDRAGQDDEIPAFQTLRKKYFFRTLCSLEC